MPATDNSLCKLSATDARTKIASGDITVLEYVSSLLERIKERDDDVEAWAYLDPELIIASAKALDAIPKEKRGPLHGVVIAVKDCILTKDMPTQQNSPIYEGDAPKIDAGPVITCRALGALILGKTVTTQFAAISVGGKTKNPHDPSRTPGGSSSGSGAAVADYQVPIAFGTQTGGSTIRPGSYNGVFALKATHGRISREGLKMYSAYVLCLVVEKQMAGIVLKALVFFARRICDTLGIYARSVQDLQMMVTDCFGFQKVEQYDMSKPFSLKGSKFAMCISTPENWKDAGPGTIRAMEIARALLTDAGAIVDELSLPAEFSKVNNWHFTVLTADGHSSFLGDYHFGGDKLHPKLRGVVENTGASAMKDFMTSEEAAKTLTPQRINQAYDGCAKLRPVIDEILSGYDAIITPSALDVAPKGLESTGSPNFNSMWTVLHTPVVNIPGFTGTNGLPIGLSMVGARYSDLHLLHVAAAVAPVFAKGGWSI